MAEKAPSAAKPARTPKLFPVTIPEQRFQAAILKRIFTKGDRDFILGLYRLEPGGNRVRAEELAEPDAMRLTVLAKSISENRGVVQVPRLVILAVIVVAALAFNLFFKNALLTRALRGGLESVFGARAEVAGLDFRLLGGRIGIQRLAVTDRDRPMRNLFELGRVEVSIDALRLLEGRIHVRSLECRDVRWDTVRAVSGALPGAADGKPEAAEPAPAEAAPEGDRGLPGTAAGLLQGLDIPSFVDRQTASLSSTARLERANERLAGLADSWSMSLAKSRTEVEGLGPRVEEIRRFDYSAVSSVKDAQKLLEAVKAAVPAVQSLTSDLTATTKRIAADVKSVEAERAEVQAAVTADVAVLRKKLDLSGGGWKSLASTVSSRVLQNYLGKYSPWVIRAKGAALALVRGRDGRKKTRPLARKGQLVVYPGAAFPRFLLSKAAFSIEERPEAPRIEVSVRDISSDPDVLGRPISLEASAVKGRQALSVDATIDTRTRRETDAEVNLSAADWDLSLREGLESLSVGSLSATAGLRVDFRMLPEGEAGGQGSITLRSIVLEPLAAADPLGAAVADALASVPQATVDFAFAIARVGETSVTVSTNLDALLSKSLAAQAGGLAAHYEGKLRDEVTRRLAAELEKNQQLASSLAGMQKAAGVDLATAGSYNKVLTDARRELERKLKGAIPPGAEGAFPLPKLGF